MSFIVQDDLPRMTTSHSDHFEAGPNSGRYADMSLYKIGSAVNPCYHEHLIMTFINVLEACLSKSEPSVRPG